MPASLTLSQATDWLARTLGAELGCAPEILFAPGVHVVRMRPRDGDPLIRRFPPQEAAFALLSTGAGAVVAASDPVAADVEALYRDCRGRDHAFDARRLAVADAALRPHGSGLFGPTVRLLCGSDTWLERTPPPGVDVALEPDPSPERQRELAADSAWPFSVRGAVREERPMRALALARRGAELVGVASITQDSERMWQIGIDVRAAERGSGVGAALTSRIARAALERDRVPYWGAASANIPSIRTAQSAGFRLVLTECLSFPLARLEGLSDAVSGREGTRSAG